MNVHSQQKTKKTKTPEQTIAIRNNGFQFFRVNIQ